VEKDKQVLLKEAVTDCELVLQQAPENVRALYLRGRAGALRADGLVQQASQLRELRYAKGLFWKAGELDRDDKKIEHERVTMNNRLQEKEEEVNADLSGPRAAISNVHYINKRSIAVEVHWVKTPATESTPIVTKKMASILPDKEYRCRTKMGDRFVVYEQGDTQRILHDAVVRMKPNEAFLHEDEETQERLKCENLWTSRGGATAEELRADAVSRPPPANECYALILADPSRSDKGKLIPNDDEPFAPDFTSKAVCLDWTAAGLDARDASKDKVRACHRSTHAQPSSTQHSTQLSAHSS
jgi:hypothetical protein